MQYHMSVIVVLNIFSGESQQTSIVIAASILALPWIIVALVFLYASPKCKCHKGVEESIYSYPQMSVENTIEAKKNEAYATNIVTEGNDAYGLSHKHLN